MYVQILSRKKYWTCSPHDCFWKSLVLSNGKGLNSSKVQLLCSFKIDLGLHEVVFFKHPNINYSQEGWRESTNNELSSVF